MVREDTFDHAHQYLSGLTDEELQMRFWHLTEEIVEPLVELARTHTSPSIERSVLMRMGIDTPTCVAVVAECETRGLLGHGAGHVVLVCMQAWDVDAPTAARKLAAGNGWETVDAKWGSTR
ncbi:MAG: ornithine aminomutase subunit alpha [Actinobacteria bacterium]|nr:ornithine aminomutase subunit alpha [Actinomycetota bacterium]MCG2807230.1 ornithine aminomutase subunit alpha [Coriobacteriia bacterium]